MEESSEAIVEARQELMVSPLGENPTLRIAYFLKPTSKPIEDSTFELLPNTLFPETATPVPKPENLPLDAAFNGWLNPREDWITWEERLHSRFHNLWKKAGILEAIKVSTFRILKDQNLLLGLAQKWYPKTNTFIFPWGEATITLEDMMVLGGYSVLGAPVFTPLETKEQKEKEEKLKEARRSLTRTKAKKVSHYPWMRYFMENDSDLEHEAFLSLWLCRFVFPNAHDTISAHVLPIAIHLASGTRIALAPAVLASIYRDLSSLNKDLNAVIKWGSGMALIRVTVRAPFQLVQVWALERFPSLQTTPNVIEPNQPRLAKWNKVKTLRYDNVGLALDNAGNSFLWRPYTDSQSLKFYSKNWKWVFLDPDSDDVIQSFALCLRLCELVGLECLEQYLPHRVAMQFGLDQDIPASVSRCKKSTSVAWSDYNKPMVGAKLYIASCTIQPSVTSQYLIWWKQSKLGLGGANKVPAHVNICSISSSEELSRASLGSVGRKDSSVPPGFPPKCKEYSVPPGFPPKCKDASVPDRFSPKRKDSSAPPGFPPKFKGDKAGNSAQENKLTIKELSRSNASNRSSGNEVVGNDKVPKSSTAVEDFAESEDVIRGSKSKRAKEDAKVDNEVGESSSGKKNASEAKMSSSPLYDANGFVDDSNGESSSPWRIDIEGLAELEARIDEVERLFAELQTKIFGPQV